MRDLGEGLQRACVEPAYSRWAAQGDVKVVGVLPRQVIEVKVVAIVAGGKRSDGLYGEFWRALGDWYGACDEGRCG